MPAPLLECRGIVKHFGGDVALAGVDFTLEAGEIHGLVGSNGAGKSTLMKILAGALVADEGWLLIDAQVTRFVSPQAALAEGIAMVYQELSGIEQLSVAENLFLGRQPTTHWGRIDWGEMRRAAQRYLDELEIDVDVTRSLGDFPLAVRQLVEIARGIHRGSRVLILDEPTSALSPPETRRLFDLVRKLRARNVAVVFVSHFIEDMLEICDRVTVLRDGRCVETSEAAALDKSSVIHAMLGHSWEVREVGYEGAVTLPETSRGPVVMAAEGLALAGAFAGVSLAVRAGEMLGLYGFAGAGQQAVVHCLAGAVRPSAGRVVVDRVPLGGGRPREAIRRGVVLVDADRTRSLCQEAEIYKNVTLPHLRRAAGAWITPRRELPVAQSLLERVGCRPANPRLKTRALSGGNQQKVALAKWLLGPVRGLLLDEPTRGMDVRAKEEIMALIAELKAQGAAIVLASTEPELVLGHADRIVVMSRGRVRHEFAATTVDKVALMRYA